MQSNFQGHNPVLPGTAALDGDLIIFGFCLRLSTDIYLPFYPIVILSVLLFTLS